jgi:peptidoglycan/xylan/chitin deacetylase (PgdA/CDA1 family)
MRAPEFRRLIVAGHEVGSHTINHPNLTTLRWRSMPTFRDEIFQSRFYLEQALGRPIRFFAYPFGAFDHRTKVEVYRSGYWLAFTTQHDTRLLPQQRFALPRIQAESHEPATVVAARIAEYNQAPFPTPVPLAARCAPQCQP